VYLRDLASGKLSRISQLRGRGIADADGWVPVVSSGGRVVAFETDSKDFTTSRGNIIAYFRDRKHYEQAEMTWQGEPSVREGFEPSLSDDGSRIAFVSDASDLVEGDTNDDIDVFVRDFAEKWTRRVSVTSDGGQARGSRPHISGNGRFVAFESHAPALLPGSNTKRFEIFVHDLETRTTQFVSGDGDDRDVERPARKPRLSTNGEWIVFESPTKGGGHYNIFIHNRTTGITERVSRGWDGSEPNGRSETPSVSADGRYVVFESEASNLVPWDENGYVDVFVRDRLRRRTIRVSQELGAKESKCWSFGASISSDGRMVAFRSTSRNLVEPPQGEHPRPLAQESSLFVADLEHAWDDDASDPPAK
jgi:Tol biopolymer transport system component